MLSIYFSYNAKNLDTFSIKIQNVDKTKWKWLIVLNFFEKNKLFVTEISTWKFKAI